MLALPNERRNGDLSFHISPVTQFRLPNSLAKRFPCATKTRPPTPRSVSATRNLILATGSSGYTRPEAGHEVLAGSQRDGTFPSKLLSLGIPRSRLKIWMRTPCWLKAYVENVCLFFGKVVLRSMNFVMTSAVSKPIGKGVTSNTSHTAPGSSPASPLPSVSSPPHSQVVVRRTLSQST